MINHVDAEASGGTCLRTERGVVTRYWLDELEPGWEAGHRSIPVPGLPSRTRLSPDGTLEATTTFVSGHSLRALGEVMEAIRDATNDGRHHAYAPVHLPDHIAAAVEAPGEKPAEPVAPKVAASAQSRDIFPTGRLVT